MKPGYDIEDCTCIRNTGKALLIKNENCEETSGEDFWVPLSQVTEDSEVYDEGHEGTLSVTEWFAEKEGWL